MTWFNDVIDVIVTSLDGSTRKNDNTRITRLKKKLKHYKIRVSVLEDIALGIKSEDLRKMYNNVKGIRLLLDEYAVKRSIFV